MKSFNNGLLLTCRSNKTVKFHCYVFPEFLQVTWPSFKSHWIPINGILKIHWLELESSDSNQWILSIPLIGIWSVGFQSMDFKYTIDWNPTSFPRTFLAKEFVKLQVSKKPSLFREFFTEFWFFIWHIVILRNFSLVCLF